jgi:murein DD-endopeptidase MepM/ murein hydrolase activator NlpD
MDEIMEYNDITEADIYVGDILIIPNGVMPQQEVIVSSTPVAYTQVSSSFFISPTKGMITNGLHYYNAVDVANSWGTPIVAAASGTVQQIKNVWPYGKYVTIQHSNGIVTTYAHLASWTVYIGQSVSQGELIGYMGNTGHCISLGGDGSHLHFEVRGAQNPLRIYNIGAWISY